MPDWIDLNTIIGFIFGGTSIWNITEVIKYRKENKQIKRAEAATAKADAAKADIEVQNEKLDLGDRYLSKVLEVSDKLDSISNDTRNNNKAIMDTQAKLQEGFDKLNTEVGNVVTYLNGDYQAYLNGKKSKHYLKKNIQKEATENKKNKYEED